MARAIRLKFAGEMHPILSKHFTKNRLYFLFEFGPMTAQQAAQLPYLPKYSPDGEPLGIHNMTGKYYCFVCGDNQKGLSFTSDEWWQYEKFFDFVTLAPAASALSRKILP